MELVGYFAALLIGVSLGLIGGGGSILTVPVLVYLFRVEPILATAYSLFIVGSTSLVGTIPKWKGRQVDLKTAALFGIPSLLAVYLTRSLILPAIPDPLFTIGHLVVSKSLLIMTLFSALMIAASFTMTRNETVDQDLSRLKGTVNPSIILLAGMAEGFLTGLVGAGGGFLIIPALVLLSKLPMKQAIGTSLLIISVKSLIGFTGDLHHVNINWLFLLSISLLAIVGIFIGNRLNAKVSGQALKKGFGWFVLAMGIYILLREWVPVIW